MRLDPCLASLVLAQISESHTSPWVALVGTLLGGGGLLSLVLKDYLKARGEREKAAAEEERLRREAKQKAELEQIEALTALARGVPGQFERMGDRFERMSSDWRTALERCTDAIRVHDTKIDTNTKAIESLTSELASDNRELVQAIADAVGVKKRPDEQASDARQLPASPPRSIRGPHVSQPGPRDV